MKTFGTSLSGVEYTTYKGVCALLFSGAQNQQLGVVRGHSGMLYLPGGSQYPGETELDSLSREIIRQTGCTLGHNRPLVRAQYYHNTAAAARQYIHSFYLVKLGGKLKRPSEKEGEFFQMDAQAAIAMLHLPHQAWAVQHALRLLQK